MLSVNPGFTGTITAEYAFTTSPTREIDFEYDHNGLRTQKKHYAADGSVTTTDYTLHGKLITHLTKRVVEEPGAETTESLHFFYDAQSRPAFVEYEGAMYRYIHNLQGDIVGIVDANGMLVVEYKYDAWGKPIPITGSMASTLGTLNPFRYRGYVYDDETRLYYLRSRYYYPESHKFINADDNVGRRGDVLSHSIYSYCSNKVTICSDITGCSKTYVFYYYFPESDSPLMKEAMNSPYFDFNDTVNVSTIPVKTPEDFIKGWNAMEGEIDDIYLYLHGKRGALQFDSDCVGVDGSSKYILDDSLDQKIVKGTVYDFSCYGAAIKKGQSVAAVLAAKTNAPVIACNVGVSYRFGQDFLKPIYGNTWHARTNTLHMFFGSHWYKFIYDDKEGSVYKTNMNIWRLMD